jgi:hypothetical protein
MADHMPEEELVERSDACCCQEIQMLQLRGVLGSHRSRCPTGASRGHHALTGTTCPVDTR